MGAVRGTQHRKEGPIHHSPKGRSALLTHLVKYNRRSWFSFKTYPMGLHICGSGNLLVTTGHLSPDRASHSSYVLLSPRVSAHDLSSTSSAQVLLRKGRSMSCF